MVSRNSLLQPAIRLILPLAIVLLVHGSATAQSSPDKAEPVKRTWRVGAVITGPRRSVNNLLVTFPIPTDWPEQHVNLFKENIPDQVRNVEYRVSDGVKQLVATIPRIDSGDSLTINVILDITVSPVAYPERTDHWVIPKRPPRDVRLNLAPSRLIESRDRGVKRKAKELTELVDNPWKKVNAIFDFVTGDLQIKGKSTVGAAKALKQMTGSMVDRSNLFVAMCRSIKIPARMVWANNGVYAEFYLQDDQGNGRWFPAVVSGKTEFGKMSNPRVIIQKGDNIKVPEKSQRQRLVVEHIRGKSTGGAQPRVRFMREALQERERLDLEQSENNDGL